MKFEWDEAKNIANQRKHGVSFEDAATVFEDSLQLIIKDRVDETGEQRWKAVGIADSTILLLVVHTTREDDSAQEVIRIISARHATRKKGEPMKVKMTTYTSETLPRLTDAQRARLKKLAERPDSEIDTTDIPELTDAELKSAKRGLFYRPIKRQITARVDADVLEWLKSQGKGYQSRINAILRREMLQASKQR